MGDRLQLDRDGVRLYLNQAAQAIPTVMNRLQGADLEPVSLTLTQPTLDDVFLQVTGQRLVSSSSSLAETVQSGQPTNTEMSER
jgi:ABC-2 type transport system ATP-binding protein